MTHAGRVATRRISDRSNGRGKLRAGRHLLVAACWLAAASSPRGRARTASRPLRLSSHVFGTISSRSGHARQVGPSADGSSRDSTLACCLGATTHARSSRNGRTRSGNRHRRSASRAIFRRRPPSQVFAVPCLKRAGRHNRNCHQIRQKFASSRGRYVLHLHRSDQPGILAPT